jgi:hypothetical protein
MRDTERHRQRHAERERERAADRREEQRRRNVANAEERLRGCWSRQLAIHPFANPLDRAADSKDSRGFEWPSGNRWRGRRTHRRRNNAAGGNQRRDRGKETAILPCAAQLSSGGLTVLVVLFGSLPHPLALNQS